MTCSDHSTSACITTHSPEKRKATAPPIASINVRRRASVTAACGIQQGERRSPANDYLTTAWQYKDAVPLAPACFNA